MARAVPQTKLLSGIKAWSTSCLICSRQRVSSSQHLILQVSYPSAHQVDTMKFSRSATFFIGFMSVGLLAVATALPAEKRQLSSILSILTTLLGLLTPILSILSEFFVQFVRHRILTWRNCSGGLGLGSLTSLTSLTPVLGEVTSVLDTATSTLSLLNALGGILVKRDATEDAEPFVQVITVSGIRMHEIEAR